ncbi:hypothetical protein [Acinetobacter lwoffii]|uniref:Uncharacterized protein n=1 Tax=Acinetobacter lwoffii NIPH 478 TaxID=1217668 RepID=N9G7R9_ACILW|nr:hypothetical protein [Acinetobacter lwoffii]ENW30982.1 hypothetical protein F923_01559 [Acinetobacter lwoffii NIPH 478]
MLTLILVLGFLTIAICPIGCALYAEAKLQNEDRKKILFWLGFIPGTCLFILYAVLKPNDPPVIPSKECGVVQFYQMHKVRGGNEFERVSIRFDGAQYSRHLFFDKHLDKIPQGQKACFEYLDKFKYPHLSESKFVQWIEPNEM